MSDDINVTIKRERGFLSATFWSVAVAVGSAIFAYSKAQGAGLDGTEPLIVSGVAAIGGYLGCKFGKVAGKWGGTALGAVIGGAAGAALSSRHDKAEGTLAGGALGGLGARAIAPILGFWLGASAGYGLASEVTIEAFQGQPEAVVEESAVEIQQRPASQAVYKIMPS